VSTETTTDLPVFDHRPGAGPALVHLHYWGGSSRTWQPVIDQLGERESVSIDFRGWSRSRHLPGPFDLHRLARDTADVIDRLALSEYVLVGHSMGGKVAQLVAATRPRGLLGLVLVAPGPAKPAAELTPEYQAGLAHAYDSAESAAGARDAVLTATTLPAHLKDQVVTDSLASSAEARTEWPLHGIAEDITAQTVRIDVPTLVVAGEHDHVEPVSALQENLLPYLRNADLTVIPRTGHLIPLEATEELAPAITAFTARPHHPGAGAAAPRAHNSMR